MPNVKGGKNYKKGKHSDSVPAYIERVAGQMVGRVVRILGNRNMLTYCNDKKMRICHICGKMKGRVFVGAGDVVLLSLRDFGEETDRGDIIGKYPPEHYSTLRKEDGINPNVFLKLETMKNMNLDSLGKEALPMPDDDEEFEFEEGVEAPAVTPAAVAPAQDDDIDIDAI